MSDFAGNSGQPGAWADLYVDGNGREVVTFGGGWGYYVKEQTLSRHDGKRGCPVVDDPALVASLKRKRKFSSFVDFLDKHDAELKFGDDFDWEEGDTLS